MFGAPPKFIYVGGSFGWVPNSLFQICLMLCAVCLMLTPTNNALVYYSYTRVGVIPHLQTNKLDSIIIKLSLRTTTKIMIHQFRIPVIFKNISMPIIMIGGAKFFSLNHCALSLSHREMAAIGLPRTCANAWWTLEKLSRRA